MADVYVVTNGCYSDYRIMAVFSTKALAEGYCEKVKAVGEADAIDIEEYPVDTHLPERLGYCTARLVSRTCVWDVVTHPLGLPTGNKSIRAVGFGWCSHMTEVATLDKEKAIKVAQDRYAEYLAEKAEIT